jgi:hypothetical protein
MHRTVRVCLCVLLAGVGCLPLACNTGDSGSGDGSSGGGGTDPSAEAGTLDPDAGVVVPAKACTKGADCPSKVCTSAGVCAAPTATDGVKNGTETDTDCGGPAAPKCEILKSCDAGADCTSGVCKDVGKGKQCQPPAPDDGVKNGDETDVDCGGAKAPKCVDGKACTARNDCVNDVCSGGKCQPAICTDMAKNGTETDVDCGGASCPRCADLKGCKVADDCKSGVCKDAGGGVLECAVPTSTDGVKNGTESDTDCGGGAPTNAPACLIDKSCLVGTDCASGGCSAGLGNKCAPLSCATAEVAGINSCGAKETGQAGAAHDSCCKSLVLPTRTTRRLDKYEITSGRYRSFLAKAGPDIRSFVTTYVAANPTSQLAKLIAAGPNVFPDGSNVSTIYPNADRFVAHSLTAHTEVDIDNYSGIRGCYNGYDPAQAGVGDYSANTYWNDATHQADFGLPPRGLARSVSDEKPLNCAMPMMLAAFCAWDGGELATLADFRDAWVKPPNAFPWGPTDLFRPNYTWCNGPYKNGGFTCQCDGVHNIGALGCPAGGFTGLSEAGVFYEFPINTDRSRDNEPLIAAPGRMVMDATLLTSGGESWHDLYANLAEYTGDFAASGQDWCDFSVTPNAGDPTCTRGLHAGTGTRYTKIPTAGIIGNTWEGHQYGYGSAGAFPVTFQYGKFGGRCVRPTDPY